MKINGSYKLPADPETAWKVLLDPENLADCIPGARSLVPDGDNAYRVEMSIGVATIRGDYTGRVEIKDATRPTSYRLVVEGQGGKGAVRGEAVFTLTERKPGETEVTVEGEGEISGLFSRVGQRMLGGVAKLLMKQFFGCMRKKAREQAKTAAAG